MPIHRRVVESIWHIYTMEDYVTIQNNEDDLYKAAQFLSTIVTRLFVHLIYRCLFLELWKHWLYTFCIFILNATTLLILLLILVGFPFVCFFIGVFGISRYKFYNQSKGIIVSFPSYMPGFFFHLKKILLNLLEDLG